MSFYFLYFPLFLQPSDLYRGQLCGACANFASSLYNELQGPQKELYDNAEEFLNSYAIHESECEAVELRSTSELLPVMLHPSDPFYLNFIPQPEFFMRIPAYFIFS